MKPQQIFNQNHILAALSEEERERLSDELKLIQMPPGQIIYDSGTHLGDVIFPITSIVSLQYETDDGSLLEVAMVGNEGIVGVALFMGGETTVSRAIVQSAGHGYQLKGGILKSEFHRAGLMQRLLLRYTFALLAEIAQTLVCNRHHSADQQLCRWLLLRYDRLSSCELFITQEKIANLLGMRRGLISEILGILHTAGLIRLNRGNLVILDRAVLEGRVCECYALIKGRLDNLVPDRSLTTRSR